jgi:hypothetical protein
MNKYKIIIDQKETNLFTDGYPSIKGDYFVFTLNNKEVVKFNRFISSFIFKGYTVIVS